MHRFDMRRFSGLGSGAPSAITAFCPLWRPALFCLAALLMCLAAITPASADYKKGITAYQKGDYATALKEFQPPAGRGNAQAQFQLGLMHEMGFGTPRALGQAYFWYSQAAAAKHPGAVTAATRLKRNHPDAVGAAKTIGNQRRQEARQQAELDRLRDERLRAEDRAGRRQGRQIRSRKIRPDKTRVLTKGSDSLVFSLPPGWDEGEARTFSNITTGARVDFLDIGPKTRLFQSQSQTPADWSEMILIDTYPNNAAHSPESLYRQWRGRVMAGCHPGQGETPDANRKKKTSVTTSFYTCAKLLTGHSGLHAMMKAVRGKKNVFFIRRFWRGDSFPVSETAAVREGFDDWQDWFNTVALAEKKKTAIKKHTYVSGFGIAVSHLGHILTNSHLVRDCRKLRFSSRKAEPVASDPASGLALFKRRRGTGTVAPFRAVAELAEGAPVVLASNPNPGDFKKSAPKTELSVSAGVVDSLEAPEGDGRFLTVTLPLVDELSGSPLLDLAGRVVGLALARPEVGRITGIGGAALKGGNFVIPAVSIKRFMISQGLRFRTTPSLENLTAGEAGDRARAFTVLVECWK